MNSCSRTYSYFINKGKQFTVDHETNITDGRKPFTSSSNGCPEAYTVERTAKTVYQKFEQIFPEIPTFMFL